MREQTHTQSMGVFVKRVPVPHLDELIAVRTDTHCANLHVMEFVCLKLNYRQGTRNELRGRADDCPQHTHTRARCSD